MRVWRPKGSRCYCGAKATEDHGVARLCPEHSAALMAVFARFEGEEDAAVLDRKLALSKRKGMTTAVAAPKADPRSVLVPSGPPDPRIEAALQAMDARRRAHRWCA